MITKPMLAGKCPENLDDLNYPVLVSPKLDGVRCLIIDGKALTRRWKPIPNDHVREFLEKHALEGMDGELMPADDSVPFKDFSGAVRRKDGKPRFVYKVFDRATDLSVPFNIRYVELDRAIFELLSWTSRIEVVPHILVASTSQLLDAHENFVQLGYEGTMVRDPGAAYKCGRSTTKQGQLLKLKDFADEEAEVLEVLELMHNDNEATKDAFGRTERSAHKENKRPAGTMGKLRMRFLRDGKEFTCGTGFSAAERDMWWADRDNIRLLSAGGTPVIAKVKHQHDPGGRKDGQKPRFPVFLAIRDLAVD